MGAVRQKTRQVAMVDLVNETGEVELKLTRPGPYTPWLGEVPVILDRTELLWLIEELQHAATALHGVKF